MAMSDEHKAALKQGRLEAREITAYLAALGSRRRGRPVTKESLQRRIDTLETRIAAESNPLRAVEMRQERLDAEQRLAGMGDGPDLATLEAGFVRHAKSYGERKGIGYAAWREQGVPAAVLKQAGVTRGS